MQGRFSDRRPPSEIPANAEERHPVGVGHLFAAAVSWSTASNLRVVLVSSPAMLLMSPATQKWPDRPHEVARRQRRVVGRATGLRPENRTPQRNCREGGAARCCRRRAPSPPTTTAGLRPKSIRWPDVSPLQGQVGSLMLSELSRSTDTATASASSPDSRVPGRAVHRWSTGRHGHRTDLGACETAGDTGEHDRSDRRAGVGGEVFESRCGGMVAVVPFRFRPWPR